MAPQTSDEYMAVYGPADGGYPVIDLDLDTGERRYSCVVVTFAGGARKAVIDLFGIAAGEDAEHLCIDVHAFVDDQAARSGVFGLEDGRRFQGFSRPRPAAPTAGPPSAVSACSSAPRPRRNRDLNRSPDLSPGVGRHPATGPACPRRSPRRSTW